MTLLAHGLGGSNDLPIPYTYALIGAAWVLTLTFAVVILAWRAPRFDPEHPGRPLPARLGTAVDSAATRWVLAIGGLLFWLWVGAAALFGPQDNRNALPGTFYVLLWVGLVRHELHEVTEVGRPNQRLQAAGVGAADPEESPIDVG